MQLYYEESELKDWKKEIKEYQDQRTTKKGNEERVVIRGNYMIKKEWEFDPVLQKYNNKEQDQQDHLTQQKKVAYKQQMSSSVYNKFR